VERFSEGYKNGRIQALVSWNSPEYHIYCAMSMEFINWRRKYNLVKTPASLNEITLGEFIGSLQKIPLH
jgi:hypothetical protein